MFLGFYFHKMGNFKGLGNLKEIIFYLVTIALLLTLRRISYFSFNNAVYVYLYIVLVIGFTAGNYYSIFMNGTLLMNMLPEVSFKNNEVIRWSSTMVCLYLGLLIPKRPHK